MKKVLCLITLFVIVFSLTSCSSCNVERKIYSSSALDGIYMETENADKTIKVHSDEKLDLNFFGTKTQLQREDAEKEKVLKIGNNEYKLSYNSTEQKNYENKIKPSISLDTYRSDLEYGNTILANFDSESGKLVEFYRYDSDLYTKNGSYTLEAAEKDALEFFESINGKGSLDNYRVNVWRDDSSNDNITIRVAFNLYLCGVRTSEYVLISYNLDGVIVGYTAENYGLFEHFEKGVTEESISEAEKHAIESLPDWNFQKDTKVLKIDSRSGACFLEIFASKSDEKAIYPAVYYINVTSME